MQQKVEPPSLEQGYRPRYLKTLFFRETSFEYKRRTYLYANIKHLSIHYKKEEAATKQLFTTSPKKDSVEKIDLTFRDDTRLSIRPSRGLFAFPLAHQQQGLKDAAELLEDITFTQRLNYYEKDFGLNGKLVWGRYVLHKNGDVFKGEQLVCNIATPAVRCYLHPQYVECLISHERILDNIKAFLTNKRSFKLSLEQDRDCLLYLLKDAFGLSWPQEKLREKSLKTDRDFYEALLTLGGFLCKADGQVTSQEIAAFKTCFTIDENIVPDAARLFKAGAQTSQNLKELAENIYKTLEHNPSMQEHLIIGLIRIAMTNGHMKNSQWYVIQIVAECFGMLNADLRRLATAYGVYNTGHQQEQGNDQRQHTDTHEHHQETRKERQQSRSAPPPPPPPSYFHILGLDETADWPEIKKAYRKLAKKYHPDLLHATGATETEIEQAAEVLKQVNEAYTELGKRFKG